MRARQPRPGIVMLVTIFLAMIGCSSEEEAPPLDPGVSPFYPGPAGSEKAASNAAGGPSAGEPAASSAESNRTGPAATGSPVADGPLRPEDVERQLRIALRTAERGDTDRAVIGLDRILALQPTNREALVGRSFLALAQANKAPAAADRAAAIEKAVELMRTLRRAHEKPTQPELNVFARVFYAEARVLAEQGQYDRAASVLKEAYDGGYDPFERIELDASMASLRSSPEYAKMLKAVDDANLTAARSRVRNFLDKPVDLKFDFKAPGLDGKPVSLDQFKGKVVIIDIWGTWCKPCREAVPGLVQLYRRHHRLGLEIVGLAFEPNAPTLDAATQLVKQFVQELGIPYTCAIGDDSILERIPDFHAFPTTMVIDRAGRVRLLALENSEGLLGALDSIVQVLLGEPATPAAPATAKAVTAAPAPPATTNKAEAKPDSAATPVPPAETQKAEAKPK